MGCLQPSPRQLILERAIQSAPLAGCLLAGLMTACAAGTQQPSPARSDALPHPEPDRAHATQSKPEPAAIQRTESGVAGFEARCELLSDGRVLCTDAMTTRTLQLDGAIQIQLVHDSLYSLSDDGLVRWMAPWQDDSQPIPLLDDLSSGVTLEVAGTSPSSTTFEFNPHHVICVRGREVRCWTWRPGWVAERDSAASLEELPLPAEAQTVVVGPTVAVLGTDGELLFLDEALRTWMKFSDAALSPKLPPDLNLEQPALLPSDGLDRRSPVRVRLASGEEIECRIGARVLCGPATQPPPT